MGVGMVVFRCDLLVLFAPLTLQMLIFKEVEFFITLLQGIGVVSVALAIAIPIDSFLWDRYITYCY